VDIRYFSAPGRVEIGGNHTDHQHGRVLAAAVGLEISAAVKPNILNTVRLRTQGDGSLVFSTEHKGTVPLCSTTIVDLNTLDVQSGETGTSAALVRGVGAWFIENGYAIGGFDADLSSTIPIGAGLSSSAAFAVLIGNIFKGLYGGDVSPLEIARAGQFAENVYFGKPCGLMDQTISSCGGLNIIDFKNPQTPIVTPINAKLPGYTMCIVSTGGSHVDLTDDYAACNSEMRAVAAHFGKGYLREVCESDFYSSISDLRYLGDRAVLRAIHFFEENKRVLKQAKALEKGNIKSFLDMVNESGRSSLAYLQNVFSPSNPQEQGLTLALSLSEQVLTGVGAWRVHGGGFAGTILAFVPDELKADYERRMTSVFGDGCCLFLSIRKEGGGEKCKV